ncbi:subclass B1 metallo-beta-lactamase [Aliikangiella sp. G2MR2-5]|uniref:subclass B1 metallo-beta-lactamase n=1 Tax=Aliikangiella sp. G2MR2-5 TaxID=2788943 RepID=UPI0018A8AA5F|nr:subclass B1 metallo-beta-lactamase [Aliikangiella sp. G2MR2-5]
MASKLSLLILLSGFILTTEIRAESTESVKSSNEALPAMEIKPLAKNVFLHESFSKVEGWGVVGSNGLIIFEDDKAFLIDTPWSSTDTARLVEWIEKIGAKLVGSLSTHSHEDTTAGIEWLNDHSIPTYASALTNSILKKKGKVVASNSIDENSSSLFEGGLEVFYPGGGHSIDNLVVWHADSKTLFGGCFVRSLKATTLGNTKEAVIESWPASVSKVIDKYQDVEIVVPGHGGVGDLRLLKHTKELVKNSK